MSVKVTVGIPTYNRKEYLRQALDSVIHQDYDDLEIIVSDNHSTDGTEDFVREYISTSNRENIKYFRMEKNLGSFANWENCHKQASGEYLLILSDDDVLESGAISRMVAEFESDVVQVIGDIVYIDRNGTEISRKKNIPGKYDSNSFWYGRLKKDLHDTPSATMFRREMGSKVLGMVKIAGAAGDVAKSLILSNNGYIKCIDSYVVRYRFHDGNDTNNMFRCASSHIGFYQLFKKMGVSLNKLLWLQDYCCSAIKYYAKLAYSKHEYCLMIRILCLLNKKLDLNTTMILSKIIFNYIRNRLCR